MVKKRAIAFGIVFLLGLTAGWILPRASAVNSPKFVGEGEVYDQQVQLLDRFVAAFKAKDAERCADLYAADAVYMVPETPLQTGNRAIRDGYVKTFESMADKEIKSLTEPVAQVLSMGEWAVLRGSGRSTETAAGGDKTSTYNWVILSRKEPDGSWKMVWDIFTLDHPSPAKKQASPAKKQGADD